MKCTFYGTRGSTAVSSPQTVLVGGNTTCLLVESVCLPDGEALVIDGGTGIVPLGIKLIEEKAKAVHLLFTHYHLDHTTGLPLSAILHNQALPITCYGPVENGRGPEEALRYFLQAPYFPVAYEKVGAHFSFQSLDASAQVLVCHPQAGMHVLALDDYMRAQSSSTKQVALGKGRYEIEECLIIRMIYTNHPERTISYRFEEKPTGKVFVFLTDHENTAGLSFALKQHIQAADVLVVDCQYTDEIYPMRTGFGHGTPSYSALLAQVGQVKRLGITHHDPQATDKDVADMLQKTLAASIDLHRSDANVFFCHDYLAVEI